MRFREKIVRFMYGRNGFDKLCSVLLWTAVILSLINIFAGSLIIWIIENAMLIWCLYRAMSKNIYKRQVENRKFLEIWGKIKGFFELQKNKFRDRKTHIYRICPQCKANLRLPKRKGTHTVKCPKCGNKFDITA